MGSSVSLQGKIVDSIGDNRYSLYIRRKSDNGDYINILTNRKHSLEEDIGIYGELVSVNDDNHPTPTLYVREGKGKPKDNNSVVITGVIGKYPMLRVMTKNYALDLAVKITASDGAEVLVPVVCFGKCAKAVQGLTIGCKVRIMGRLQSRVFTNNETKEKKTVHEVSAFNVSILEN